MALKASGAVQAARWTPVADSKGYIYSFNGPHSLFVDTLRSLRSLALAHQLGHVLMGERDQKISLLVRLLDHAETTARYSIYYGEGRDAYDIRGRTAHESIFNLNDGSYRCPNSQQGYSPFSTWTRGLAWAILGYAEQLEFLETTRIPRTGRVALSAPQGARRARAFSPLSVHQRLFLRAATATADFYLANTCTDGIPMWDTGAPGLHRLGHYLTKPSDPHNNCEPVDSSAAAIAAQGLLRLGNYLVTKGEKSNGERYRQAALTVAGALFDEPYLSTNPKHQGLLLHSVYHRPNGWDYIAPGEKVPNGESSMWGDYHAREIALLLLREARHEAYPTFFACGK
jgi:unsaturated chondroitin disaccharide hydrolase